VTMEPTPETSPAPTSPAAPAASTPPTQPFQPAAPEPGHFEVPPQALTPMKPKGGGMASWINFALGLALAVAIGGVAFAAGRMTAPATAAANGGGGAGGPNGRFFQNGEFPDGFGGNGGNRPGGAGGFRGAFGGASIQGTVTAVTPSSITIHTASGQDVTIALDTTTTYHQQSSATSSDVKTGGTVIVRIGFGGQPGSETPTGPTANDVTVVP